MIDQTLRLLGHRATCRVTGFSGVVSSVCFDLYGCVQAALSPPLGADGKIDSGHWFDVSRLIIDEGEPVMAAPDFAARTPQLAEYEHGPAEKPAASQLPAR